MVWKPNQSFKKSDREGDISREKSPSRFWRNTPFETYPALHDKYGSKSACRLDTSLGMTHSIFSTIVLTQNPKTVFWSIVAGILTLLFASYLVHVGIDLARYSQSGTKTLETAVFQAF